MSSVFVLTLSGQDQPGVTAGLTTALSQLPLTIKQIEQIVLQGHLVLGVAVQSTKDEITFDKVFSVANQFAKSRNLSIDAKQVDESELLLHENRIIVTVLGSPLNPIAVSAITKTFLQFGGNIDRIRQVASYPVTAIEFEVAGIEKLKLRMELSKVAKSAGIDIAVQDAGLNRRGVHLVVMDVDSTFIQEEVIDLLAAKAGVEEEVAKITARAMNGQIDFEQSLRSRVEKLKGISEVQLHEILDEITLTPGANVLCRTLNNLGFHIGLVSGGFNQIVAPLAARMGVEHFRANELEIIDGVLTGKILGSIVDRAGKAKALRDFADLHGIPLARTIAIGDGANDLDMLHDAGLGIAFNAKPSVRDAADATVNSPYLDSVLFLLGITRDQIDQPN